MSLHELALAAAELTKPGHGVGELGLAVYPVAAIRRRAPSTGRWKRWTGRWRRIAYLWQHRVGLFYRCANGRAHADRRDHRRGASNAMVQTQLYAVPSDAGASDTGRRLNLLYKMPLPPIPILQCSYGKLARGIGCAWRRRQHRLAGSGAVPGRDARLCGGT